MCPEYYVSYVVKTCEIRLFPIVQDQLWLTLVFSQHCSFVDDWIGVALFVTQITDKSEFDFSDNLGYVMMRVVDCHRKRSEKGVFVFMSVVLDTYQPVAFQFSVKHFQLFLHGYYY